MSVQVSVILNTSNRARALELSLVSLMMQTHKDFELIIADDGSTDSTAEIIQAAKTSSPIPITHVWQNKDGHGRTAILNKAIGTAGCDCIFFTDCDVLARPDVLETHLRYYSPKRFLLGGMVRMSKEYSDALRPDDVRAGKFEEQLTSERLKQLRRNRRKADFEVFFHSRRRPHIYATNMFIGRQVLLEVNGFDENYRGWGNADGDLRERLKMTGLRPKAVYDEAIVFHLYHEPDPTVKLRLNRAYSKRRNIPARCLNGIIKLQ